MGRWVHPYMRDGEVDLDHYCSEGNRYQLSTTSWDSLSEQVWQLCERSHG